MEEVHYGGEGPHWAVVSMKKKGNEDRLTVGVVSLLTMRSRVEIYALPLWIFGN